MAQNSTSKGFFNTYDSLVQYWNNPKERAKVTTPQALQKQIIFGVLNLQELYKKGEVQIKENLPSVAEIKRKDNYEIFQLANKLSVDYFFTR